MSDKPEVFTPTCRLRLLQRRNRDWPYDLIGSAQLQQQWVGDRGATEWRPVPIETEDAEVWDRPG